MSLTEAQIKALAEAYLGAEEQRTPLEPLSISQPELTAEEAYRVQEAIVAHKLGSGEQVSGMKVGATNPAIQKMLGVDSPVYGTLFRSSQVEDGGSVRMDGLIHPRVECEIAFRLGRDLAGSGVTEADALAATESVLASLEINDARTREWKIGERELIADNGVVARFVLGEAGVSPQGLDLAALGVVLRKNGEEVATARGEAVLGHPARAVAWLANKLAETGRRLSAGMIILPGSLTPLAAVVAGDAIEAEFERLGRVRVRFE